MATLNEIVNTIADGLNKSFDFAFKQKLKFVVKYHRARFIRQEVQKYGLNNDFLQSFTTILEPVDVTADICITTGCNVLKSTKPVPDGVRLEGYNGYAYCGSVDGKVSFSYAKAEELPFKLALKYGKNFIYYEIINNYLYVYNNLKFKYIRVKHVFSNPEKVNNCNCDELGVIKECYNDDMEFPISLDLLPFIVNGIIKGELTVNQNDMEVDINKEKDDRD